MHQPNVWSATALINNRVYNNAGEHLGKIEDVVIDPETGYVQYAILSFGGVLGMGNKLFPVPWTSLQISHFRKEALLNIDKETLRRTPGFEPGQWPDMTDTYWRSIHDHYGGVRRPVLAGEPSVVADRRAYVERPVRQRRHGISLFAAIAFVCLALGLAWMVFLIGTRGWDQAKQDLKSSLQGAAYAARETSSDAALTTKVKSALALSKRIPAGQINVDSEGDVVTLRGEVPSDQVRDVAEQIARDVPGVREVHNHLFSMDRTQ